MTSLLNVHGQLSIVDVPVRLLAASLHSVSELYSAVHSRTV